MDSDLNQCWNCRKPGKIRCNLCKFAHYCSKKCEQTDRYRHEAECEAARQRYICSGCGCTGCNFERCSVCFQVYYCQKECQTSDWPRHKYTCKEFITQVLLAADESRVAGDLPSYIGTSVAEDYLRLYQNEGTCTDRNLRLLFIGVGDLKDVVRTVTELPPDFQGQLQFVLNDIGPHVSARNLLFLYCALFQPDAKYLVHVWYSLYLTPVVLKYLVARLKELATQPCKDVLLKMRDLVDISEDHWSKCVPIWAGWHKLALDPDAAERMMEIRHKMFDSDYEVTGLISRIKTIPQQHHQSVRDFMKKGLLLPLGAAERRDAVFPNCTMACYNPFHPEYAGKFIDVMQNRDNPALTGWGHILTPNEEMIYSVRSDAWAPGCWDYLVVKETVGMKDDLLDMYFSYLNGVFQAFMDKVEAGFIKFRLIIDHFENLDQHFSKDEHFDRIAASNLSDYFHFPLFLKWFGPRLNRDNDCSVLITHHNNWPEVTGVYDHMVGYSAEAKSRAAKDASQRSQVLCDVVSKNAALTCLCCIEEYFDTAPFFFRSLVTEAAAYLCVYLNLPLTKERIVHPNDVAKELGMCLRDYLCELNHVVPYTREGNTRRISIQINNSRYVEWTLLCDPSEEK